MSEQDILMRKLVATSVNENSPMNFRSGEIVYFEPFDKICMAAKQSSCRGCAFQEHVGYQWPCSAEQYIDGEPNCCYYIELTEEDE